MYILYDQRLSTRGKGKRKKEIKQNDPARNRTWIKSLGNSYSIR